MNLPRRPRLAIWLHERSLPRDDREAVIGDLLEGFAMRATRDPRAARRWVWAQTCRSLPHNLYRRWRSRPGMPDTTTTSGGRIVHGIAADIRFAVRLLKRQPTTSMVALVSLTAALGLNVLLVTLADAALFRSLPLRSPGDLVLVLLQRESGLMHNLSYPDYADLRDRTRSVEALTAYASVTATIDTAAGALPADGEAVSGNLFEALGVPIRAGRALSEGDDRAAAPRVVVISERLWRERFAGAPPAGQMLPLNGEPYSVIGVADGRFTGMQIGQRAAFWVPLAQAAPLAGGDHLAKRNLSWLTVVGRLRSGVARTAARDELDAVFRAIRAETKGDIEPIVLQPGSRGDSLLSAELASPLTLLLLAGAVVLLVACLNVANLQLARTDDRQHELAVRSALGARRTELVRLVAIDGFLLALVAAALGVALAAWLKNAAVSLIAFYGQPVALDVPLDVRTMAAAGALALIAASMIAALTVAPLSMRGPASLLASRSASRSRSATQRALVVVQIALSMALVTAAALLVRTVDGLRHADLGFDPAGVAVVQLSPEMGRLPRQRIPAYFDELVQAARAVPGVTGAAVAHVMPLDFGGSRTSVEIAGYQPRPGEDMHFNFTRVTPGYFAAMGIPLLQGRPFDERDRDGQPERIIVNETMARRYWPEGRAVGRLLRMDSRAPFAVEVIGVVRDVHYRMVREDPQPSFYVPIAQWPPDTGVLHARVAGPLTASRIDELRTVVAAVNPAVPITRAHSLIDQIERNIADERMATAIGVTLAAVALLLAVAGLYATMAFVVGRRTREIGVRIALGARAAEVRALVLREGITLAAIGVVAGTALATIAGGTLESLLYGVASRDVASLAAAAVVLTTAAVVASWIPARRASRVDPVVALRDE
jgi:predicted permease